MLRVPSFLRRALASGVFLAGSLGLSEADAQTLTFLPGGIVRNDQDPDVIGDTKINLRDCQRDDYYTFSLNNAALAGTMYNLEVWASEGKDTICTDPSNQSVGANLCRQVAQVVTNSYDVRVYVRDIVKGDWGPWDGQVSDDASVCETDYEPPSPRRLHFFTVDFGGVPGPVLPYDLQFDLLGPGPPGSVKAGVGQNALVVSWKESSNASEVDRYRVYAEPVDATGEGGASGDPDAGTDAGVDAGTDAGTPTACASSILNPGEIVPEGTRVRGEANASSSKAEAGGLRNGVLYAAGVASVDDFNNSGKLSALVCGTPEPVTGFFEAYRAAGGAAGGGYCSLGASPSRLSAAGVALAALGLVLRRRRTLRASERGEA